MAFRKAAGRLKVNFAVAWIGACSARQATLEWSEGERMLRRKSALK